MRRKEILSWGHVVRFLGLLWFTAQLSPPLRAQEPTFLEKLEAAVREQLNQKSDKNQEELPAPQLNKNTPAPATTNLPSILESRTAPSVSGTSPANAGPPVPPPTGSTQPLETAPDPSAKSRQVYLGLEAEGIVGGGIGVRVSSVSKDSPAWKAGFQIGDRIQAINGFAIADLDGMVTQLQKTVPGQAVRFLISRAGRNRELVAVLMDAELAQRIESKTASAGTLGSVWLGVLVNDLTGAFRKQFGISAFRGAAVTGVTPNSPAAKAGIRAGDAIIEANARPIESADDLMSWMTQVRAGQKVQFVVYRGSNARVLDVVLEVEPNLTGGRTSSRVNLPPQSPARVTLGDVTPGVIMPKNAAPASNNEGNAPTASGTLPPPTPSQRTDQDGGGRVKQLEQENRQLRQELSQVKKQLEQAQLKLDQILSTLRENR